MIGGLVFREGDHHPDMRLHLVPTSEVKQEDTWYLRRLERDRLEHGGARQRVRAGAPQRVVLDAARCALAGLQDQHQSDLPHAVHRGALLRFVRPGARPGARRLRRVRAVDQAAIPDLHAARDRAARAGADPARGDRRADRCRRAAGAARACHRAGRLYRHDAGDAHAAAAGLDLRDEACCATRWMR